MAACAIRNKLDRAARKPYNTDSNRGIASIDSARVKDYVGATGCGCENTTLWRDREWRYTRNDRAAGRRRLGGSGGRPGERARREDAQQSGCDARDHAE